MEEFVRNRITQLRLKKGVSEYQMSYDLGHSRGYINNIALGKCMPSLKELFAICDYFEISPHEFFDTEHEDPALLSEAIDGLRDLDTEDLILVLSLIQRLHTKSEKTKQEKVISEKTKQKKTTKKEVTKEELDLIEQVLNYAIPKEGDILVHILKYALKGVKEVLPLLPRDRR